MIASSFPLSERAPFSIVVSLLPVSNVIDLRFKFPAIAFTPSFSTVFGTVIDSMLSQPLKALTLISFTT